MWVLPLDNCHLEIRGTLGLTLCKTNANAIVCPCVLKSQVSEHPHVESAVTLESQEEYPVVAVLSGKEITWYTATEASDPVTG